MIEDDLAHAPVPHPRHLAGRHHRAGAGGDRHGALGPALPARRAAAVVTGRRGAGEGSGLHDRGRLAAAHRPRSWSRRRSRRRSAASAASRSRSASRTVAEDAAGVAAVREAVGPELELMVDANQGFTLDEAMRRARALEPWTSPGSRSRCRPTTSPATPGSPPPRRSRSRSANRSTTPGQFRDYLVQRRLLDRAGRRRPDRRRHALAQGGAPRGGVRHRRRARTS